MTRVASLCDDILIADMAGDRPAKVTKVYAARSVEVCAFMPLPQAIMLVTIHDCRAQAINACQRSSGYHAYWKP